MSLELNIGQINYKVDEIINFQEYLQDKIVEINSSIEQLLLIKTGPEGRKGDKGDRGDRGAEGPEGPTGKGERGSPGRDGKDGRDGCDGRRGKHGKRGKDCKFEFTEFLVKIINTDIADEYIDISCIGSLVIRNQNFEDCKNIQAIYVKVKNGSLYFMLDSCDVPVKTFISANGKTIDSNLISYTYGKMNVFKLCFGLDQSIDDYLYPGCVFSIIFYWCF